jgi:hypothetical protein
VVLKVKAIYKPDLAKASLALFSLKLFHSHLHREMKQKTAPQSARLDT